MKKTLFILSVLINVSAMAQKTAMDTPPMGFMTWNYFGLDINEHDIRTLADSMVESELCDLGYNFIFIDDGWQGGRDNKNNWCPLKVFFGSKN